MINRSIDIFCGIKCANRTVLKMAKSRKSLKNLINSGAFTEMHCLFTCSCKYFWTWEIEKQLKKWLSRFQRELYFPEIENNMTSAVVQIGAMEFFLNVSLNLLNSVTKILVIKVKGLKLATSCVRDQDATTFAARYMWETGYLNWAQFMLQWFIRFREFVNFSESSARLGKNSTMTSTGPRQVECFVFRNVLCMSTILHPPTRLLKKYCVTKFRTEIRTWPSQNEAYECTRAKLLATIKDL